MPLTTQQFRAAGELAAHSLFARLHEVYAANCMLFGHHDSLAYGRSHLGWKGTATAPKQPLNFTVDKSDIAFALMHDDGTTDAPSLYSWDLIGLEHIVGAEFGDLSNSNKVLDNNIKLKDIIAWVKKVHRSGGINMFCWHVSNPLTLGSYNDISNPSSIKMASTPNTNANKNFKHWLLKACNFFKCLIDDNGLPIPIIFRPFHEMTTFDHPNGYFQPFFWWNQVSNFPNKSSASHFKNLWNNTQALFKNEGVTNLVYAFCINDFFIDGSTNKIWDNLLQLFPNSNTYDILCFDAYQRINLQWQYDKHPNCNSAQIGDSNYHMPNFINRQINQSNEIERLAISLGKLPAISEFGASYFYDSPNWWTQTLQPILNESQVAFINTWRNPAFFGDGSNSESDKTDYYSAYYNPTGLDENDYNINYVNDFIDFYINNDRLLFLNEFSNPAT